MSYNRGNVSKRFYRYLKKYIDNNLSQRKMGLGPDKNIFAYEDFYCEEYKDYTGPRIQISLYYTYTNGRQQQIKIDTINISGDKLKAMLRNFKLKNL